MYLWKKEGMKEESKLINLIIYVSQQKSRKMNWTDKKIKFDNKFQITYFDYFGSFSVFDVFKRRREIWSANLNFKQASYSSFFIWDHFIEKIERAERETSESLGTEANVRRSDGQAREVDPYMNFFRFDVTQFARGLTLKDTHTHICSAFVSV